MSAASSPILVLNGAEARMQVVCGTAGELLLSQEWFTPRQGMRILVPAILDGLARMQMRLTDIGRIAVVNGPGSFTGLRLVLSTALGLARPLGLPMAGLGYMNALAADAARTHPDTPVWTLTHARRGLVHLQGFSGTDTQGSPVPFCAADAASLEDAAKRITDSAPGLLLGTGVHKNLDFFAGHCPDARILPARFNHPAPETLLDLAVLADYSMDPVVPQYIRPCDAEENLDTIAAARGMDPSGARSTLHRLTHD